MMKRICALVLLATIVFLSQLACNSSNQANAPANTSANTSVQGPVSDTATPSTPSQNAPAQTAQSKQDNNQFPELVMLYSQLFTARMKNDKAKVESLLADDYKETTNDGKVITKAQVLADLSPDKKFDTYQLDNLKATTAGDTGTVTGRVSVMRAGKTESWQFTDTFKKEKGRWLAVSAKITDYKKS